jgi:hypothetical protein
MASTDDDDIGETSASVPGIEDLEYSESVVDLGGRRSTLQIKEKAWLESQVSGYLAAQKRSRRDLLKYTNDVRHKWIKAFAKPGTEEDGAGMKAAKRVCFVLPLH